MQKIIDVLALASAIALAAFVVVAVQYPESAAGEVLMFLFTVTP